MSSLTIEVSRVGDSELGAPHPIKIQVGSAVLTKLMRSGSTTPDDRLNAPPFQLAFWLVDNWWRLRWECLPIGKPTADWWLSHSLSSIGGGFAWPRATFWGDGAAITIKCLRDPINVLSPVRFLTDTIQYVAPSAFEAAIDQFFELCIDGAASFGDDRLALLSQVEALNSERTDPETSAWRRIEAQSGYDVDQAPDTLMIEISELIKSYGGPGVDEAVQGAPGEAAASILISEIEHARTLGAKCNFSEVVKNAPAIEKDTTAPAWTIAEQAAVGFRKLLSPKVGKLSNKTLCDFVEIDPRILSDNHGATSLAYGLRLHESAEAKHQLVFKSRWVGSRRFELARAIGDVVWDVDGKVGPLADSKTTRQQFQRAFAQSLLCPFDELCQYINVARISNEDISAASKHFDVSEGVIRTTLVNKGVIDRARLDDFSDTAI